MKPRNFIFLLLLCLCLSACGGAPAEGPAESPEPAVPSSEAEPPSAPGDGGTPVPEGVEPTTTIFRVVDGAEEGNLLLAKLCKCTGADVCRLPLDGVPVTLDGEPADASALEDGMLVEVSFNGVTLETFPAQLGEVYQVAGWSVGTEKNPGGICYDLCGLYLQVLDDLWNKDPALNEDISLAGLDLSQAPGDLAQSEKAAIAWRFGEAHGVEVVTGTFEELKEQGYFTASAISTPAPEGGESPLLVEWKDGCLFSITANEDHQEEVYSLPTLFFNAEKWRAPLAAYGFHDCSAVWPMMGTWSGYQIAAEFIS